MTIICVNNLMHQVKFWLLNCQSLMTFKLQKQQSCIITAQDKYKGTQKLRKILGQTVFVRN